MMPSPEILIDLAKIWGHCFSGFTCPPHISHPTHIVQTGGRVGGGSFCMPVDL